VRIMRERERYLSRCQVEKEWPALIIMRSRAVKGEVWTFTCRAHMQSLGECAESECVVRIGYNVLGS
jgi:hypothetical protein